MIKRNGFLMSPDGTNTSGGGGDTKQGGGEVKVDPAQARTYLAEFVPNPDDLKTMPDDKVLGWHSKVSAANKKALDSAIDAHKQSLTAAEKKAQEERLAKVPQKYELKLSDDSLLDPTWIDKIAAQARSRGLSNEEAQQEVVKMEQAYQDLRIENVTQWNKAVESDKDLGGANFTATKQNIQRFVTRFAPAGSDLGKLLDSSGYGSHPAVVRLMNAIGKAMAEDKPLSAAEGGAAKLTAAERLYGKSNS